MNGISDDSFNARNAPTAMGPELPQVLLDKLRIDIPGYQFLDKIDAGGQATVYRAKESTSGLTVAIKVLNGGANADAGSRERLKRETAALKALNHPNIVCVIESGQTAIGLDYLVMILSTVARWMHCGTTANSRQQSPLNLRQDCVCSNASATSCRPHT